MDYLLFLCGLSLLLLAAISFSLRRPSNPVLPWIWLGIFGIIHGLDEWIKLLVSVYGWSTQFSLIEVLMESCAFLCLAEFGLSGIHGLRGKDPGLKLRIPLVILALLGLVQAVPLICSGSRVVLILIASAWAASTFTLAASHASQKQRLPFYALSASIAIYGVIVSLLVLRGESYLIRSNLLFSTARYSAELIRVLLVSFIAILLWIHSQKDIRPEIDPDAGTRFPVWVAPALLIIVILCGWFITGLVGDAAEARFRSDLLSDAVTAASAIDSSDLLALSGTKKDIGKPIYEHLSRQLSVIYEANPLCRYVYLIGMHSGKPVFLAGTKEDGSIDNSNPGLIYKEASHDMMNALRGGPPFIEGPLPDEWGDWVSGIAPIRHPYEKKTIAVLGIDIDASVWQRRVSENRILAIGIIFLLCSLVIALFSALESMHASRLAESRRHYQCLVEDSPSAIALLDPQGRYLSINRSGLYSMGFTGDKVLGKYFYEIWPEDVREQLQSVLLKASQGERCTFEATYACSDEGPLVCHVHLNPVIKNGQVSSIVAIGTDITERIRAESAYKMLATAVDQSAETIMITDPNGNIRYVNPAFERVTGYTREEALNKTPRILKSEHHDQAYYEELWNTLLEGQVWTGHFSNKKKDGSFYDAVATISPVRDASGKVMNYVSVERDVTQERALENQLRQSQKLESIGQLAAGIAHEINTPTQYIGDNTRFVQSNCDDLFELMRTYGRLLDQVEQGKADPSEVAEIRSQVDRLDIDFLSEEIPQAIKESLEGIERVTKIVRAMKEFSHPGVQEKVPSDLNRALETTITVARNEWKYVADVQTDFDPNLPLVPCFPGDMNQVFLNIIINAAHAIDEARPDGSNEKGLISISTRCLDGFAEIRISDTGTGIPEAVRDRIFDPFFTTKEVGKGTGQGLAISHSVVVEKHKGRLSFETQIGKGTTFIIALPIS